MNEDEKQPAYKTYQVPYTLYEKLEEQATEIRKETGKEVSWSGILRNIIEAYFEECSKK